MTPNTALSLLLKRGFNGYTDTHNQRIVVWTLRGKVPASGVSIDFDELERTPFECIDEIVTRIIITEEWG